MFNCNLVLNYETMLQIDTNYGGTPVWATVKKGILGIVPANNEVVTQNQYSDGEGNAETHVTGGQFTVAVTAHRFIHDSAQDYIFSKLLKYGCERTTQARYINALGEVKLGVCTIAAIVDSNGAPEAEGDCSFEIHFNGKPTITPATTAPILSAVVSAGSVAGSTSFAATPTGDNTLAYVITTAEPTNAVNAMMYANVNGYVSGANIPVVADNYLNMFELDADKRIVKYMGQAIASGDIA